MKSETDDRAISEAIRHLAGTHSEDKVFFTDGEVIDVDIKSRTCTVSFSSTKRNETRDDVRLMSSIDDGVLITPTKGSTVTVIFSTFTQPVVISFTENDRIDLRGGDLGGIPIVGQLLKKLNNLENFCNDLASKFNSHIHTGVQTGVGVSGPTNIQEQTTLTPTVLEEIENENVTHG